MNLTKNTKLFYSVDGLDMNEVLSMHAVIKDRSDAARMERGAKKGRIRKHLPTEEAELAELQAYIDSLPDDSDSVFPREVYEVPSDTPARIKQQPKDSTLIKKYQFFIHNLISRQIASDDGIAYLNSKVMEAVIDKDYTLIIRTLLAMDVIKSDNHFILGEKSYGYSLTSKFRNRIKTDIKPLFYPCRPYVNMLHENVNRQQERTEKQTRENMSDGFYSSYMNSLQLLRISHSIEATQFINTHFSTDNPSKLYHQHILEQYIHHPKFHIQVPNTSDNRIYHILTSTPRNLKYFLNIKFTVDIHNSHPLLFSKILMDEYNIPLPYRNLILTTLIELYRTNNRYNIRVKLYNKLKKNSIDYPTIKGVPLDVLKYLYLTATGQFWDVVIPQLEEEDDSCQYRIIRQDVKVIMFAQVFYGKTLSSRGQQYAKQFKKKFPNVFKTVLSFKRGLKKEERTVLTHKLMALESSLFREALKRLYAMRFKVVSIHDAIVVLDVKGNEKCTPNIVKSVLADIYGEHGLIPDCSVDFYVEEEMREFLAKEEFLRERGDQYIAELRTLAETDEEIKQLIEDYDNGKSEIVLTPDKKDVMLHLKDVKSLMYQRKVG